MRAFLLLSGLAIAAGFIGKDACKEMSCHSNVNNAPNARWKGNTRNTRFLGAFATVSECETACVNFKDRRGNTCKSFAYHSAEWEGTCMVRKKCFDSQCFAVIDDSWDPKDQMYVVSGKIGIAASSVINKAFTSVTNITEEAVVTVMGAQDAKSEAKKPAAKPAPAPKEAPKPPSPKKEAPKAAPKPPPKKAPTKEKKSSKMRESQNGESGATAGAVLVGSTTAVIVAAAFFITGPESKEDASTPAKKAAAAQMKVGAAAPAKKEDNPFDLFKMLPKAGDKPVTVSATPAPAAAAAAPSVSFSSWFGGSTDPNLAELENEFRKSGKIDREGAWLL
eukprot:CAMPEP_0184290340 /NCGR_PEP_ID=MMETSP1049-20130417/2629_1 /TAXON_ID=77928 /ORGANISM="Proteomonas sulcata, Strain CCMP704" /LENGTH=334 /DNA_ID=CAMNT_0026597477 /DNA_START=65 /DNA_END=1069 /DNA_ORIENTATION=-